ncbi:MAG: hypothetical protein KDA29_00435 [Phycisphaerales bacterium]|nr:hypothetical protein [Phycisphaerales bacterium]
MSKKNIILTLWLISPIATFAGLYVLIFVTLDKDRPMADAVPYGAGAGDTGDANAIGQWLAGRNPDAISLATKAKREGLMISPTDWPGGVRLTIPARALPEDAHSVYLTVIFKEQGRFSTTGMKHDQEQGVFETKLEQKTLKQGARFVIATSLPSREGDRFVDDDGRSLAVLSMSPVLAPRAVDVNDPLPVLLPIESVYRDTAP